MGLTWAMLKTLLPNPQAPTPGKFLKVAYTLDNKSGQNVQSSIVGITLPGDVTYSSSGSKPMGGGTGRRRMTSVIDAPIASTRS